MSDHRCRRPTKCTHIACPVDVGRNSIWKIYLCCRMQHSHVHELDCGNKTCRIVDVAASRDDKRWDIFRKAYEWSYRPGKNQLAGLFFIAMSGIKLDGMNFAHVPLETFEAKSWTALPPWLEDIGIENSSLPTRQLHIPLRRTLGRCRRTALSSKTLVLLRPR